MSENEKVEGRHSNFQYTKGYQKEKGWNVSRADRTRCDRCHLQKGGWELKLRKRI